MNPRQYKQTTLKKLYSLSGNQCANPECENKLVARDEETMISKICHIEAASERGPRYNSQMTDDDRRSFSNLLLLCDECHSIIDNASNVKKYTVNLLKEWKEIHEHKQASDRLRNPSLLKLAVNAISGIQFKDDESHVQDLKTFKIPEKITYNSIKRNLSLIEEYKVYNSKISSLYSELEKQGSFKKENLLRNIKNLYLKVKGRYVLDSDDAIEKIRENSDNIIEDIEDELYKLIDAGNENYSFEISIIMVDAFMRCKIMEEPL